MWFSTFSHTTLFWTSTVRGVKHYLFSLRRHVFFLIFRWWWARMLFSKTSALSRQWKETLVHYNVGLVCIVLAVVSFSFDKLGQSFLRSGYRESIYELWLIFTFTFSLLNTFGSIGGLLKTKQKAKKNIYIIIYIYVIVYINIFIYIHINIYVIVYINIFTNIYIYICVYIHIYVYIFIYTYLNI